MASRILGKRHHDLISTTEQRDRTSDTQRAQRAAKVARTLFGSVSDSTRVTPPPPPLPPALHEDWIIASRESQKIIHNGVDITLTFLAKGRFKNVYKISVENAQTQVLADLPNEKVLFKCYKKTVEGEPGRSRTLKAHEQRLKKGLYSENEKRSYTAIKDIENENFRSAKAFFFEGYSFAEYVEHDPNELKQIVASAQSIVDQAGFDALPAQTKEIFAKIKVYFAFVLKVAIEKGVVIDLNLDNICLESFNNSKRLVYLDNYELESNKNEALLAMIEGLKAFSGKTSQKSFSPFIYKYLLGEQGAGSEYVAAYNVLKSPLENSNT